jgi:MFS family permease
MQNLKQKLVPVAVAIGLFLLLSIVYMYPTLQGKNLKQQDVVQHHGMSKELVDYRNATGKEALWTNSMFGGMPGYMVSTQFRGNKLSVIHRLLVLGNWRPICFVFLYLIGFYLALLAFGVNPWLSIVGAIAYGFSSYFFIIIDVGHISKVLALGYLPPIIGGIHLAFRKKYLWGGILTGIALGLQLYVVHLQITYYTMIIAIFLGIAEFVFALKDKELIPFFKALGVLIIAALLAVGCNFSNFWTTYEYGKFTTRGKSDLTLDHKNQSTGLDKKYATDWSYGIPESFTLLMPNFMGGASVSKLPQNSKTYEFIKSIQGAGKAKEAVKQMPTYWGKQPGTAGPVYAGAIVCFLFILGLFIVDDRYRWWLLGVTFVSLILAWGNNIPNITNFLLDHLPAYNKFRAVSMTMVIAEFSLPLLAILALDKILKGQVEQKFLVKSITWSVSITGGLLLFFIMFAKGLFSFEASVDAKYIQQGATEFVDALQADRLMLFRQDALRSLVLILLSAGVIVVYLFKKIKLQQAMVVFGLLILMDMWPVAKRYLNSDNFVSKREYKDPITESQADRLILTDKTLDYRVLNLAVDPFNDATTSYFHKSLGGYHGAKMERYQELIQYSLTNEINEIYSSLKTYGLAQIDQTFANAGVVNMLNTKYLIFNPDAAPLENKSALGNAWFVGKATLVQNADEEITKLNTINTGEEALVDKQFESNIQDKQFGSDTTASIVLDEYQPNFLKYSTSSNSEQLAVFSEIYYPAGWNVTIDGRPTDYFRADYVLRAMVVPAGKHTIEFKFHPKAYFVGEKISLASSLIFILILLGAVAYEIRKNLSPVKTQE